MAGVGFGVWACRRVLLPLEDAQRHGRTHRGRRPRRPTRGRPTIETSIALAALVQRDGGQPRGAHRARRPVRERCQPRAAVTADDDHGLGRGPQRLGATTCPNGPDGARPVEPDLERFRQLVGDLLEISRYDVGGQSLDLDEFGIVEFVPPRAAEAELRHDPGRGGARARDHRRRRRQTTAGPGHRQPARQRPLLRWRGDRYRRLDLRQPIEIAVEDAGPGVPEDERSRDLRPLRPRVRRWPPGRGTGTGLGLALVAEHVRLHGGEVFVTDPTATEPRSPAFVDLTSAW